MAARSVLVARVGLTFGAFVACSFDDRVLQPTDATSGGASGSADGGTGASSGAQAGSGASAGAEASGGTAPTGEPCQQTTDCPKGKFCDGNACAPVRADGAACATAEQCSNAHCSTDKVCCDEACTTKCSACIKELTGVSDGTCAFVKAGSTHADDCAKSAQCNASATAVTSASACDGKGECASAPDIACMSYRCNPATASCRTSCTSTAECADAAYCAAKLCKTREGPGTLCDENEECQSNLCGGRCCNSGAPCKCPQPSAGNLMKDAGFDADLVSWTVDPGPATVKWQPGTFKDANGSYADANACAYSGAAFVSNPSQSKNSQNVWQCLSVAKNTSYDFGVRMASSGAIAHCVLDLFADPGCMGALKAVADVQSANADWSKGSPTVFDSASYTTAKVSCFIEPGGSFFFDDVYMTPEPGLF